MTAVEVDAPDTALVALVADFCAQLKRTMLAYRLYGQDHDQAIHHEGLSHQKIRAITQQIGAVVLNVVGETLTFQGQRVLQDDDRQDPVVGALFADGITQLIVRDGVTALEVGRLFRRWNTAMRGKFDSDYSLSTALWEDEIDSVSVTVVDVISDDDEDGSDGADLAGRVKELLRGLRRGTESTAVLRIAPAALSALARRTRVGLLSADELKARGDAERLPTLHLSAGDLVTVAGSLEAARRGASPRALVAMFHALAGCTGRDRDELLGVSRKLMGELLSSDRMGELTRATHRVIERATAEPSRRNDVEDFMAGLGDGAVLESLIEAVDDRKQRAAALLLLQYLPRRELPALLRALVQIEGEGRTALVDLAARKRPAAEQVFVVFDDANAELAAELFRVARRVSAELFESVLRRAFDDARPGIALQVLKRVKPPEVPVLRAALLTQLRDGDDTVRDEVVTLLARARDPAAVDHLRDVAARAPTFEKKKAAIAGLVAFADDNARAALRALFEHETQVDVRVVVAGALATSNDTAAIPLLEAAAKPLFADRALKAACRAALARLAKRTAP